VLPGLASLGGSPYGNNVLEGNPTTAISVRDHNVICADGNDGPMDVGSIDHFDVQRLAAVLR